MPTIEKNTHFLNAPSALAAAGTRPAPRRDYLASGLKLAALCLLLGSLSFMRNGAKTSSTLGTSEVATPTSGFDWDSLTPSDDIVWTDCAEYRCARLLLPLDYLSPPGVGPKAVIAMRMIPATDRENYKGTILVNPGGPGGAGSQAVLSFGKNISTIVGPGYDILGFDPRGTGATIPSAACFDTESQHKVWDILEGELIAPDDGSLPRARARASLVAQRCVASMGGTGAEEVNGTVEEWGGGRFMSTPSVATDMLKITEKLGQDKLLYWGFSYGTVLGQYFSAMYPDKVGRVVIDGILDGHSYRDATWDSVVDAENIRFSFVTFCRKAGMRKCPLWRRSEEELALRVEAILAKLERQPVALPFTSKGPQVLQYKDLVAYTFQATYSPSKLFGTLADILLAIETDNSTRVAELYPAFQQGFKCDCTPTPPWLATKEGFAAIACSDSLPYSYSEKDFQAYYANLTELSYFFAPVWAQVYLQCSEWAINAKWRYTAPLTAPHTANPLLMISTRYDPVCPLSDALKVHARFPGSGFLLQNSYGHCSISAPSLCTAKYIRAYFDNGTIPEERAVCEPDTLPFIGRVNQISAMSEEDKALAEAWDGIMEGFPVAGRW